MNPHARSWKDDEAELERLRKRAAQLWPTSKVMQDKWLSAVLHLRKHVGWTFDSVARAVRIIAC